MSKIRTKIGGLPYAQYLLKRVILEGALEDNYTTEEREEALRFFGRSCAFCGAPEAKATRNDHLIPVIECGDFISKNLVPACQECDDSKGQKEFHEWMRCDSPKSLSRRGFTKEYIECRIKLIEKWQAGYKAESEKQLFGKCYDRYETILGKMDDLCKEAERLIKDVKG